MNVDGTGLEQLTDGTWNDFDPCWLPNGRIAFISERRGGYLRCGRACPNYTLFDMAADGSDITCLSFHETNEWQPSVTHDGRIIYTRWDYVDRHGCTAHLPWITTLDGRDSRARARQLRPAAAPARHGTRLPGDPRLAQVRRHGGPAPRPGLSARWCCSIPHVADDDGMAPVRRLTPEVGFPESQGGAEVYGTAWPLSEDYYLCVYDAAMQPGVGCAGKDLLPGNYGIYLVDSFGNKELIYRDPEIALPEPDPAAAGRGRRPSRRRWPRGDPDPNPATGPPRHQGAEGTLTVVNVYDSLKPWPDGHAGSRSSACSRSCPCRSPRAARRTRRPCAWPAPGDSVVAGPLRAGHGAGRGGRQRPFPRARQQGAVLPGDRPAGPGRAVDAIGHLPARGRATGVRGLPRAEARSPQPRQASPLALQRGPSRLKPDVDGSNPFSYPRLVQPVLDSTAPTATPSTPTRRSNLAREPITQPWYASYASLVGVTASTTTATATAPRRAGSAPGPRSSTRSCKRATTT